MRRPRPGSRWSRARLDRRGRYAAYIDSEAWFQRRERWYEQWLQRFGTEPACLVCERPWTLRSGDLHHRSYDRLGEEAFTDLVPLCRGCHTRLHDVWDCSPGWRKLGRSQATIGIFHALRKASTVHAL
jgi:5-methylcytosine-specific restriction endonuclease McrA